MQEKPKVIQVNEPCSKCGSHYRRGFRVCNICGADNELSMPSDLFKGKKAHRPANKRW